MADDADLAQSFIPEVDASAISHKFTLPSNEYCDECGEDIPEKRRALGGVTHCVFCQGFLEEDSKRRRI